jgi:hypothetical protein
VSDSYVMANANRCTVHPQHVMVNRGRVDALFADVYQCDCGERRIGNTDESRARHAPGSLLHELGAAVIR